MDTTTLHRGVLLKEVVSLIDPKDGDIILDATLGGAGHAQALLERARVTLIGLDADPDALARARRRLSRWSDRVHLCESYFGNLAEVLDELGVKEISHALFDLGLSLDELETSGKGFSFQREEPLLMTFGKSILGITARDLLNTWGEEDIANVLFGYGEERYARRIARAVVVRRKQNPIETTTDLVAIIESVVPAFYRRGRIHPATRTFQALRVAVNDELSQLKGGLAAGSERLARGGKIVVISFESITDRIVKNFFKEKGREEILTIVTKKPITPTKEEKDENPRARSAKLRAATKI